MKLRIFTLIISVFAAIALRGQSVVDTAGVAWLPQINTPNAVLSYAFDSDVLYGATNFGLFKTTDNGGHWSLQADIPRRSILGVRAGGGAVLAAFADSKVTYLTTGTQSAIEVGVYVSNDGGENFTQHILTQNTTGGSSPANLGFNGLFQKNDSTYYLSYRIEQGVLFIQNLLWVTTDRGNTWTLIPGYCFKDMAFVGGVSFGIQAANNVVYASDSASFGLVDTLLTPSSVGLFDLAGLVYRSSDGKLFKSTTGIAWDTIQVSAQVGTLTDAQIVGSTVFGLNTDGKLWGFGFPNFTDATAIPMPSVNMSTGIRTFVSGPVGCMSRSMMAITFVQQRAGKVGQCLQMGLTLAETSNCTTQANICTPQI